ncbi:hypothetical protein D7207_20370 [Burkholderia cepacia]|nr:hypothetical protein [Burkholderia cepacia]MBA9972622.1 hypothetical protein [Burkholderia cepacia]MBA9991194.1 hypothetical protein [Burkholderia cepacia]MBA9999710.1 hypothetical protein [Burkholderia cepacia]MBB0007428.1 hypothetical protein [Burkholderia cepacia]
MPITHARGRFIRGNPGRRHAHITPITHLEITPDKRVDASHSEPLPSLPSNYMECSVNTDASCSWCLTNLTAA